MKIKVNSFYDYAEKMVVDLKKNYLLPWRFGAASEPSRLIHTLVMLAVCLSFGLLRILDFFAVILGGNFKIQK